MRKHWLRLTAIIGALGCLVPLAAAQNSKLIFTSAGSDISADGNSALGTFLDPNVDARMHKFTRGSGHTVLGPVIYGADGNLRGSSDFSIISWALYNGVYNQPFNPPFGYYTDTVACCNGSTCTVTTIAGCTGTRIYNTASCSPSPCPATATTGACCDPSTAFCTVTSQASCASPNYWLAGGTCGSNPCRRGHYVPHRFNSATGQWTNLGSFPNVAGTGAAKCDASIAQPWGISANGQFVVGSGNYGPYGTTACNTRGFVWTQADSSFRVLPPVNTGCQVFTQAEYVTTDGLIVCGTDTHAEPTDPAGVTGPTGGICNVRTLAVWERPTVTSDFLDANRTILDRFGGGGLGTMCMTPDGKVFADLSDNAARYDAGDANLAGSLVRYQKVAGTWTRTILGKVTPPSGLPPVGAMTPRCVSSDGNTVIGVAVFGGRSTFFNPSATYIWKAGFNGGVPVLLDDYLATINGGPFPPTGRISSLGRVSADGNALLVSWSLGTPVGCTDPATGLVDLPRPAILYLNGTNIPCEQPRIVGGPYDRAQEEYTQFGIVGNVFFSGSYPMAAQWQKESPAGSNNWVNLTNSCGTFSTDPLNPWIYEGTQGYQLRVNMLAPPAQRDGNYRVVMTNTCGSATSQTAAISAVTGACCYIDPNSGSITCSVELQNRCVGSSAISYFLNGVYLGNNTTCSPSPCGPIQGACCYVNPGDTTTICVLDIAPNCQKTVAAGGRGGTFVGVGTTCLPNACDAVSGACCFAANNTSNVQCSVVVQSACTQSRATGYLGGTYRGSGVVCQPTTCNSVAGACCYAPDNLSNVICTIQLGTACVGELRNGGLQGIYIGAGSTCTPANLCADASGACCYTPANQSSGVCTIQTQLVCTTRINGAFFNLNGVNTLIIGLGGVYRGDGSVCSPTACNNVFGACCYTPVGSGNCPTCISTPQTRCTDATSVGGLAGTWAGANSTCSPTPACSLGVGACCVSGFCNLTCQAFCDVNAGTFRGVNTTCSPDPCVVATPNTCCRGATCSLTLQSDCTVSGAVAGVLFVSGSTACNATSNFTSPCCFANYNKSGGITVQDIFDFLADWFSNRPFADVGGNGSTLPTVQDIFDFLAAWFSGGCN